MAKERQSTSLQTPIGIACFMRLWEPGKMKNSDESAEAKYSVMLVFTPDQYDALKDLRVACIRAAKERFGEDEYKRLKAKGKLRLPWRDAEEYSEYGEPFVEGNIMINFQTNRAPGIVDARAQKIMKREQIYSGCKMLVSYAPWAYDTKGNKGVTLLLNNCQKAGDGERLSGGPLAEEEFKPLKGSTSKRSRMEADEDEDEEDLTR